MKSTLYLDMVNMSEKTVVGILVKENYPTYTVIKESAKSDKLALLAVLQKLATLCDVSSVTIYCDDRTLVDEVCKMLTDYNRIKIYRPAGDPIREELCRICSRLAMVSIVL